jgi:hypothetical protein
MVKVTKSARALFLVATLCMGLGACGTGNDGSLADGGANSTPPAGVSVKTGTIASDSWGYTGTGATQVAAPGLTLILAQEHSLLIDASRSVVSGSSPTKVSSSSDAATLDFITRSTTARLTVPGTLVSYLDISMGSVKSTLPALSVTVDVSPVAPGTTLNVYHFDPGTGKWVLPQTALVSNSQTVTFAVDSLSLWAVFR